jgi:hypothetical protein
MEGQMSWVAEDPASYIGQVVGSGQCVAYVQRASGAPHTSGWRQGVFVKGNAVPEGTAIATFDPDGTYGNHPGLSHAAILHQETPAGLLVWDQWVGHPVAQRTIYFRDGVGSPVNDGDQFYVIESA